MTITPNPSAATTTTSTGSVPEQATAVALAKEADQWLEVYNENFSHLEQVLANWASKPTSPITTTDTAIWRFREKKYRWETEVRKNINYYWIDYTSYGDADNISVEVETQQVSGTECASGLIFRYDSRQNVYYYFQVYESTKKFAFGLNKNVNGVISPTLLLEWDYSPYISSDEANTLKVIDKGGVLYFLY